MNIVKCFPQGKFKVLTLSYDDGKGADRRLVEILNANGIKGTFHLNSGLFEDPDRVQPDEVASLYRGHEVAVHTLTHPTIERCSSEQMVEQVLEDRKNLEALVGYPVRGMSYPNGSHNEALHSLLPHLGIRYSRIVGSSREFSLPDDPYQWQSTCHHNTELIPLSESFLNAYKSQYLYLMYVWGHSYEFDRDDNWDLIETFCQKAGNREDIWYASNIEIIDYLEVLERLQFSGNSRFVHNPSAASAWLNAGGKIVEIHGGQQVSLS